MRDGSERELGGTSSPAEGGCEWEIFSKVRSSSVAAEAKRSMFIVERSCLGLGLILAGATRGEFFGDETSCLSGSSCLTGGDTAWAALEPLEACELWFCGICGVCGVLGECGVWEVWSF